MCDHEGQPCPGRSCQCVCDNCQAPPEDEENRAFRLDGTEVENGDVLTTPNYPGEEFTFNWPLQATLPEGKVRHGSHAGTVLLTDKSGEDVEYFADVFDLWVKQGWGRH